MSDDDALRDALYRVARRTCHALGLPWTDPRTGVTYPPPPQCTDYRPDHNGLNCDEWADEHDLE